MPVTHSAFCAFRSPTGLHHCAVQIQLRDIPGFVETRHQLLILKPANRNHWICFAVAHHLNKNHELAVNVSPPHSLYAHQVFIIRFNAPSAAVK